MARVLCRQALPFKHMAEVPLAVGTNDFHALHAQRVVGMPQNGPRDFVVERRPAATAVKFIGSMVKRGLTTTAYKNTIAFVVPIFARKGPFGTLFGDHVFFFGGEAVPIFGRQHIDYLRF